MHYRIFGRHTGLKVSQVALGTGRLGRTDDGKIDAREAQSVLAAFAEAGGNLIDTSDAYLGGEAEKMVGEFLGSRRDEFVVASKYSRTPQADAALGVLGNTRKAMAHAVEGSLKRLRTDHLDFLFNHFDDRVTPVEEIVRGFDDLVRAGKLLYAGFSNFAAWRVAVGATLAGERGWVPIAAMQLEYNLLQRTVERELLPMADGLGLGVLGYSPLAGGVLTDKPRAAGVSGPKSSNAAPGETRADTVLDVLRTVAHEIGTAPGHVATAWVDARGVLPILGARTRAQLEDNLRVTAVHLAPEHVRRLDAASAVPLGYPHELTGSEAVRAMSTADRWDQIEWPAQGVA